MVATQSGGLLREHFPILKEKTYLASHSLGAVCEQTGAELQSYYHHWATLGIEAWDGPFWDAVTDFQGLVGGLLGWPAEAVCPMLNVTRGMAGLASALDFQTERNRVLVSELEFTTTFPFWWAQQDYGAEVVVVPSRDGVTVSLEDFQQHLDERTLLVVCSHAFFRSGALCPELKSLCDAVHAVGGHLLLDVYQTMGAVPVKASQWGVDAVVGGCHKWLCGGPGAGFLALSPTFLQELRPRLTGWFGLAEPFAYAKELERGRPHPTALRFLAGTPNVPALYAARPALRLISRLGLDTIREQSIMLTEHLRDALRESGISVKSPADPAARNGMLCLELDKGPDTVAALAARGIVCDWRPDCGLRVSPHFYSTRDDLEHFLTSLREIRP